jgi:hypothetical protein
LKFKNLIFDYIFEQQNWSNPVILELNVARSQKQNSQMLEKPHFLNSAFSTFNYFFPAYNSIIELSRGN